MTPTQETYGPLSYSMINSDISAEQKQLARERMGNRSSECFFSVMVAESKEIYKFDGKHYSIRGNQNDY